MKKGTCFLCKKAGKVFNASIALNMGGEDLPFCFKCLENMTGLEFWKRIFHALNCAWPPKEIPRKENK